MSNFYTKSGVRLTYAESGKGKKAIVFIHGMLCSKDFFQKQISFFKDKDYHAVAVDLRGHGDSDKPLEGYTVKTYASDVHELIQKLNLEKPILVGWSMGSMVIWDYFDMFPGEVGGLVCVDQSPSDFAWPNWKFGVMTTNDLKEISEVTQTNREPFYKELIGLMLHAPSKEDSEFFLSQLMKIPPVIAEAIVLNQTYQDYRETIKNINVPTFVAFGEDPKLNPPEAGMWIKDNIKDSKIKIFKNSSHCPFWEEPDEFNKAVKDFADSIK
ncbi:alpha/beta hydrolase [Clostridium sp. AWRP]|uniref:alpha/beta fold hydrolase n=1 Tax=Clostridium sp. AWRP TaxID=2212991 RepID=UPI000FD773B8|nr:alpha/beta hydrolase [Clostridium sp. AWRP]AZV55601.1 alpha/beta fold hydrolase [Clostridium sp. AWRP]